MCEVESERDFSLPLSLVRFGDFHKSTAFFFTYKNYRPNDFLYFVVFLIFRRLGLEKLCVCFCDSVSFGFVLMIDSVAFVSSNSVKLSVNTI